MKAKRFKNMGDFAETLGLPAARGLEAQVKANLAKALIEQIKQQELTHQEVADAAGVARSSVTGIVNGSLQKVTVDRLLRILGAIGISVELKIKKSA